MTALEKIRAAVARLDHYGAPADNSPLYVDENNSFFELLDAMEGEPITLGDLRLLIAEEDLL